MIVRLKKSVTIKCNKKCLKEINKKKRTVTKNSDAVANFIL